MSGASSKRLLRIFWLATGMRSWWDATVRLFQKIHSVICLGLLALMPLSAADQKEMSVNELTAQAKAMTEVLKKVVDLQSAQALQKDLSQWRDTPLVNPNPDQGRRIQEMIDEDEIFREAFMASMQEMQRIEALGGEVTSEVMVAVTGRKPVNLVDHIEKTTAILEQIKTQGDLDRLGPELRQAWKPFADMMMQDMEQAMDFLENNPALQPALAKQKQVVGRLNAENSELAAKISAVMLGEELVNKMNQQAPELTDKEAGHQALPLKASMASIQSAVASYQADNGRMPFAKNEQDQTFSSGKEFAALMTGEDKQGNPRGIRYLDPRALKEGHVVDPWGKPMRLVLDASGDGKVTLPAEYGGKVLEETILIDSAGPDGNFATVNDNVFSWGED